MKFKDVVNTPLHKKIIFVHIICWIAFIAYELGIVYAFAGKLEGPYIYLIFYPINIAYFYLNLAILNYAFGSVKAEVLPGVILFLILLFSYLLVKGFADYWLDDKHPLRENSIIYLKGFYVRNLVRALYFTLLAIFYWAAGHISVLKRQRSAAENLQLKVEKENAELETALAKTESAYRQQQLNPHMLFNTLNFIYSKVQQHSEDAARCVWLLSEIMRFSLEASGTDGKVNLEREATQIENLLEITHYRFSYPIFIDVNMEGHFQLFRIIPLILLTLTENVFKHGNLTEAEHPATIRLNVDEQGNLIFFTKNFKKPKSEYPRNQQIGLDNVRIRLDAEYRHNYKLEITEPSNHFELKLTLIL